MTRSARLTEQARHLELTAAVEAEKSEAAARARLEMLWEREAVARAAAAERALRLRAVGIRRIHKAKVAKSAQQHRFQKHWAAFVLNITAREARKRGDRAARRAILNAPPGPSVDGGLAVRYAARDA